MLKFVLLTYNTQEKNINAAPVHKWDLSVTDVVNLSSSVLSSTTPLKFGV